MHGVPSPVSCRVGRFRWAVLTKVRQEGDGNAGGAHRYGLQQISLIAGVLIRVLMQGLIRPRRVPGPYEGALNRDEVAMTHHPMGKFPMTQQLGHGIRASNFSNSGRACAAGPTSRARQFLRRLATRGQCNKNKKIA